MQPSASSQRTQADRRQRPAHPFALHRLRGRRRQLRRTEDLPRALDLDWHQPQLFLATTLLMLLCVADAHNTLQLLSVGASEINPFMDLLIRADTQLFVAGKLGITGVAVVILAACHNYRLGRYLRIRHLIYGFVGMYATLIVYQLNLWPSENILMFIRPDPPILLPLF